LSRQGNKRTWLGLAISVANDPTATLAVQCGNGFDAGFQPLLKCLFESIQCCLVSMGATCGDAISSLFSAV
jgi:hypothetical protein